MIAADIRCIRFCAIFIWPLIFVSFGCTNNKIGIWYIYYNKDTSLAGYRDADGSVRIEPNFAIFSLPRKFDNIIAATEEHNGQWTSYFLTKTGRKVGRDSLFIFDNGPDCENEGFIRFRDKKTDNVGMFDSRGNVTIPAVYNDLSKVRNGLVVALRGAIIDSIDGGEHQMWKGGRTFLIDTKGKVLVNDFSDDKRLNYYSIKREATSSEDTTRISFKDVHGTYLSFINYEKEFQQWLLHDLLHSLTIGSLKEASNDSIIWRDVLDNGMMNSQIFIDKNFELLKGLMSESLDPSSKWFVTIDGLNPFTYVNAPYEKYFNNCGEPLEWRYPVLDAIISHGEGMTLTQNHFEFLRTDNGYKLISVTIRDAGITK